MPPSLLVLREIYTKGLKKCLILLDLLAVGGQDEHNAAMSDLFAQTKDSTTTDYSAKDIEVLEGLEPVRRRPGMYIGGTDERALHHLVVEILDNAMDEAVAGHASRIELELHEDGSITVRDNGRGIPIDPHPKFPNKSALEVILTTLHSGAKFGGKSYETSGGLHGVGLSVVNALSAKLIVEVAQNRTLWRQEYSQGHSTSPLEQVGPVANRRGTSLTFTADPEIFGSQNSFKPEKLYKIARSKAYLFKGVQIKWICAPSLLKPEDTTPQQAILHFPGGLSDYLQESLGSMETATKSPFSGDSKFQDVVGRVEWAIAWPEFGDGFSSTYCNTVATPDGGTHENGFRQAILKGLKAYGERTGQKKANQLTGEDCLGGAAFLLSTFVRDPQFQGQTKDKLVSVEVTKWVEGAVKDFFDHWLTENPKAAEALLHHVICRMEDRLSRKKSREVNRQSATRRLRLPGKLSDCSIESAEGTEIFLVEGDSAGGSAKQARDRKTQAILPLRGKILNVASATADKLRANQEISDMCLALGCGIGKDCDVSKLRYERVIIMTDADVDGAHIASLLITFFFQQMRPLINHGKLFLAQPPLYRLTQGGKSFYARDDAHKEELLKKEFKVNAKVDISRFKGLGEMPARQLKETTMDAGNRTLIRVHIPQDIETHELTIFVDDLMGRKPEKRFLFIQENAQFVENLDV